jgi:sugar/nucleoside kinase (ribokinase family)
MMDVAVFGLIVADLIAEPMDLRNPPAAGGLVIVNSISVTTGGNVCNSGIAMAKFGMKVAAAGMVGDDVLGRAVIDRLNRAELDTTAIFTTQQAQTSASIVAVEPGGERVFFHTPGATPLLDAAAFRRCFPVFQKCAYLLIGYFGLLPTLTPELAGLLKELRVAAPNLKIALDTVNPTGPRAQLDPILPHLDIFAPSRTEAAALTDESDPKRMIAAFRQRMPQAIIAIKLDAQGCLLDDAQRQIAVPAYPITVVDSTGAGDTWYGGLIAAMRRGLPLEEAGRFANRAAADCCTALGASTNVRSFEETAARM